MASDSGYGFICTIGDLISRNKAGKPSDIEHYRGERARKGSPLVRGLNAKTEVEIIE